MLPIVAAAVAAIQVGAAMVATRFVIEQTAPASLALLRYAIGVCCLVPPVLMSARVRFAARDIAPIALLGITQFGILIAVLNWGLRHVPSGRAALIFALFPLLTMLVAAALDRERLTVAKSAGVLLTILGVALALADKLVAPGGGDWRGELAVLVAALIGAVCSVLYRPYLRRYPVLPVCGFAMLASVGFLALLAVPEGFFADLPRFTPGGWAAVVFIGVGSGGGYYLWLWALGHASPTRVTVFLALSPLTAAALGALLLGEALTPWLLSGLVAVVLGLWVANWPEAEPA
ncbi:MAG: DMT family transporter [Proteobacteria bacterium]|nr:DMT family transporter [Pseudomonadota bacterium]